MRIDLTGNSMEIFWGGPVRSCPLRRHPQLAQAGYQVFLGAVALDPVAVGAEQLQVFDVIAAAVRSGG